MANTAALQSSTALSPVQYERQKTSQGKAEDVIYTLNHAITCLSVTDLFVVGAVANVYKKITNKIPGWAHDHGDEYGPFNWVKDRISGKYKDHVETPHVHGPSCSHGAEGAKPHVHGPEIHPKSSGKEVLKKTWHNSKGWLLSEAIGDLGAVPVTVAIQRMAPGFMDGIRHRIEPVIGKAFKKNTRRAAENWGAKNGLGADSQEVVDRAHELYEYEMRHIPQMALWTPLSIAMNYGAIAMLGKRFPEHFEDVTFKNFMANKVIGATITAGLVLGVRGMTPGGAHKWDQTVGKKVIVPVTKAVGGLFGVKSEDVDAFQKNREEMGQTSHSHNPFSPHKVETETAAEQPRTKVHSDETVKVERLQPAQDIAQAV